jgi:hypothetical protein
MDFLRKSATVINEHPAMGHITGPPRWIKAKRKSNVSAIKSLLRSVGKMERRCNGRGRVSVF